jgi:AbrB family looped-hinge helix DNA binding protein
MLSRAKIVKGGKVSIPAIYRKSLNMKEGDEIVFTLYNNELTLTPVKVSLQKARDMVRKYHPTEKSLTDNLIAERRIEAENE